MSDEHETEIVEMTDEESDWFEFEHGFGGGMSTPGCDCNHDGMAPAWHSSNCPGALRAYRSYARHLHLALWNEREERRDAPQD